MDVSVVMINYNTFELAKNAIESIFSHTDNLEYEIILIDNNSPDQSGKKLYNHFGDKIRFIQANDNLGTSKAFNKCVEMSKGKYILWLNSDIIVYNNFIYKLFVYMESNSECGISGGNLFDRDNKPTHSYLLQLPSLKTIKKLKSSINLIINKLFKTNIKKQFNFSDQPKEVGYITGADMMIRRAVIDEIGGFDEDIFMYSEETEFTYRMKKKTSYKVISVPQATMQHFESGSFGEKRFSVWHFETQLNGDSVYFEKCYGRKALVSYLRFLKRFYNRMTIINFICFRFQKSSDCKIMKSIVNEKLRKVRTANK